MDVGPWTLDHGDWALNHGRGSAMRAWAVRSARSAPPTCACCARRLARERQAVSCARRLPPGDSQVVRRLPDAPVPVLHPPVGAHRRAAGQAAGRLVRAGLSRALAQVRASARLVGQSVGWSVGRSIGRSVGQSAGWSVSRSVGQSVGYRSRRSIDRLAWYPCLAEFRGGRVEHARLSSPCVSVLPHQRSVRRLLAARVALHLAA